MRFALAALVAAGIPLSPIAIAAPIETAPVGEWKARPIGDPKTKAFSYCAVESRYDNGLALLFARNKSGEINVAIGFPDKRLQTERHYSAKMSVDGKLERTIDAFAPAPNILVIPAGANQEFHDAIRRGNRLLIEGSADAVAFSLKGSSNALDLLKGCVDEATGGAGKEKEKEKGKAAIPTALETILTEARLGTVQIIDLASIKTDRPMDYAWTIGNVFGGVKEAPMAAGQKFSDVILAYIDGLEPRCPGRFASDISAPESTPGFVVAKALVSCTLEKSETIAPLLFYAGHGTFTVFFHEADQQHRAEALKARDSIAEVIRRLATPSTAEAKSVAAKPSGAATQSAKPSAGSKRQPERAERKSAR